MLLDCQVHIHCVLLVCDFVLSIVTHLKSESVFTTSALIKEYLVMHYLAAA